MNPKQIKHFSKVMLSVMKTDKIDTQLIALYRSKMEPKPYKMPSASIQALKQQKTLLFQLKKQLTISYNLLESLNVLPKVDDLGLKMLNQNGDRTTVKVILLFVYMKCRFALIIDSWKR